MLHAREDYNRFQDPAGKIGEDEPVFLLRAQDTTAPATVRFWANSLATFPNHDQRAVKVALDWAQRMEQWQEQNSTKLPDLP